MWIGYAESDVILQSARVPVFANLNYSKPKNKK